MVASLRSFGVVGFVACAVVLAGCALGPPAPVATPPVSSSPVVTTPPDGGALRFDGERALGLASEQVLRSDGSVRTRVPGSAGNEEVARWIEARLNESGLSVSRHAFSATYGCEEVAMRNVVGERAGSSGEVVLFGAHFDTRPVADKDPDPANRDKPIPGAVDGASGVAVLLELARVLPPTRDTVRFVFFDGEDGGGYLGDRCTDWILGSSAYAASLSEEEARSVRAMVLVDMVGAHDMVLPREPRSSEALQDDIYGVADRLGYGGVFLDERGVAIEDDHVPFLARGIPAVDLIHTVPGSRSVFPSWHHTMADDLDALSAEMLGVVGRTLEAWLIAQDPS